MGGVERVMRAVNESIRRVRDKPPPPVHGMRRKGNLEPDELRHLATLTLANTEETLQALQDELRRMAGIIVGSDHYKVAGTPDYHKMYSLMVADMDLASAGSSSSSSSSDISCDEQSVP